MEPCPLIFDPIYKPKIWGARNLERLFKRPLPPHEPIGESWECADLDDGVSVVSRGPAKGQTLRQLIRDWGTKLTGNAQLADGRFPLLIKFLDATADLSVQVHPVEGLAPVGDSKARFKNEAWYILTTAANACVYRGLRPGITKEKLVATTREQPEAIVDLLQRIPVKAGDLFYLPGGTIHALGAGCVVAEVQTPSDTTYRLYDWGRVRPGNDAGLHIEEGLACVQANIDFGRYEQRSHNSSVFTTVTRMVTCPNFIIEKVRFIGGVEQAIPYHELVIWIVLEGQGKITYHDGSSEEAGEIFRSGDVVVLPAGLKAARLKTTTDCVWLEVTVPC